MIIEFEWLNTNNVLVWVVARNLHTKEYQCGNKDDIKSIHYIIIIIINQLIHSLLVKTSMGPRFYSIINFHLKCCLWTKYHLFLTHSRPKQKLSSNKMKFMTQHGFVISAPYDLRSITNSLISRCLSSFLCLYFIFFYVFYNLYQCSLI